MSIIIDDELREMLKEEAEFQQEAMIDPGFNTLHNELMKALKDKCRVTNVVRSMLGKEKFDIISNDEENKIKVVVAQTGTGCEVTGRNDNGGFLYWRNVALSRALDRILEIFRNPKEAFSEASYPSTLLGRYFQEAGDDEDDDEDSIEDIENDMKSIESDDDDDDKDKEDDDDKEKDDEDIELGKDDSDVQNEYDEEELTTLNKLIADEQEAIQGYFDASEHSKNDVLIRLYSDIGKEERFHTEQLLYAKAELTGEKYEPSDPKVKEEYEELLAGGMDEETAMYTIADKHSLGTDEDEEIDIEELEDIENDMKNLEESFNMSISNCSLLMAIQESSAYVTHTELRKAYAEFAENMFVMEAMDNIATKQGSEILGTTNPFLIIGRAIKSVYMAIINLVKKLKNWINKRRIKNKRVFAWLKKHGIKGLFANGVNLYFWSDDSNSFEISDAVAYMNLLLNTTEMVRTRLGIQKGININNTLLNKLGINKAGKTPVISSPLDGKNKIDGVVFTKTKVIVTDSNSDDLETMFFGTSHDSIQTDTIKTMDDGSQVKETKYKNVNIYNALNSILEMAGNYAKATEEWLQEVQKVAMQPGNNIASKKPELFKECLATMKSVSAGYAKLIKCINSDIATCMNLDKGLLQAVQQGEESGMYKNYGDAAYKTDDKGNKVQRRAGQLQ